MELPSFADQIVIGLGFVLLLVIGGVCSLRGRTDEGYFLAGRSMPGWVVGFSMMATIISSMTFLAIPAFAFGDGNWKNCVAHFMYVPAILVAIYLFIPLFRGTHVSSAYEYLERRFGLPTRMYAAGCFVLFHLFRTGIVLYAVSLAIRSIFKIDDEAIPHIILEAGLLVSAYTIVGGLQAVIWTDVVQGIALIIGGLLCLPIIVSQLPGGFGQLFSVAVADNKFELGSTAFTLGEKTLWAYILAEGMVFLHMLGTDQTNVQRYCAARSDKDASRAAVIGCCLAIRTWTYFLFLGTCLYVFVKVVPDSGLQGLDPDQVFPRFILNEVPPGVAGFVLTGLLASAMSTLDSSINAVSATLTTDFYTTVGHGPGRPALREHRQVDQPALQYFYDHNSLRHLLCPGVGDTAGRPAAYAAFGAQRRSARSVPAGLRDAACRQPGCADRHLRHCRRNRGMVAGRFRHD